MTMNDINPKIANLSAEKRALLKLKLQNRKNKNNHNLKYQTISPRENRNNAPLSFAQQRLWFLAQLEPNSPFYNISKAVRLSGDLNVQILQQALDAIVCHHEILHTNYISENGDPIQVIAAPRAVELPIIDLQQYGQVERETQVQKLLQQESQRPFNLESDVMLRGCLLKLAPQEHILLSVMHHIASDGWSMGILWEQLTQLYQAFLNDRPNPLETLPIQYADYAVWQKEWLSDEILDRQLSYWQQQLAGAKPLLELPTDHPRPAAQTYRGASQSFIVPKNLCDRLKQLDRQSGVTLYMSLLAAFQTLLYRYSSQEDIVVGSGIAGRNRAEIEKLIGFFVNTLVLRTDLSGNPSFQELLARVRANTLDAYSHQDLPFEKLVEELNPERSLSYSPLFQVMFVLQNTPRQAKQLLGLKEDPVQLEAETTKFDLLLSVIEKNGTLVGSWNYSTDLFNAATIERMTAHFQTLLEGIVDNPQQPIAQLPLLTTDEREQLLVEWNDTYTEYPQKCIHQLFEEQVERTPDAVAVVFEEQQVTYRELNKRANQLAHYLQKLGVKPDMLVGICVERSVEMLVGLLGILKAGGAYVPLDSKYPKERLNLMLSDSQVGVLLTQKHLVERLPELEIERVVLDLDWENIQHCSQDNPVKTTSPENTAYVIYTSGSTGKPKGVVVPHQGIDRLVLNTDYVQIDSTDVIAQVSNCSFDAATFEIWGALLNGASLAIISQDIVLSPQKLATSIREQGLTVMFLTTALFNQISQEMPTAFETMRYVLFGGEAADPGSVKKVLLQGAPENLLNVYGPTENTTFSTWYRVEDISEGTTIPIGTAIANTQVYILDTYLQPVPIGVPGELYLGGDGLAKGYFNRPELTAEKFIPNPFSDRPQARLYKTGDLACYLPDGNIEFLGRKDYQVKIRGFRIELNEIESVLAQHPAIQEIVVIAREDNPGDKRLVAYVVSQQEQPHSSDLRSFLQERLPNYMMPSAFVFLDTLPLTPNGKVDRRALPAPDASNIQLDTDFVPPSNPTEEKLATIWAEVLGVERVGIHDNFFELGGHSLLALRLFAKIEQVFGRIFSLATLFEAPTVKDLANVIDRKQSLAAGSCLVPIQPKGSKPPLFLLHARGTSVLVYRNLANYLGTERPVYGIQPQGLNGEAEILTTVKEMAAYYIQEIRKIQPIGPYLLGGYSFGGELAFEMSRQLLQQGEKVDQLILFDCNGPNSIKRLPFSQRTIIHFNNLLEKKHDYIIEKAVAWKRWLQQDSQYNFQKLSAKVFQNFNLPLSLRLHSILIEDRNEQASRNHQPQFYPGKITLMRSNEALGGVGLERDKYLGWKDLVGQIDIYHVPGHHFSMLEEPHVQQLAEAVKSCLNT